VTHYQWTIVGAGPAGIVTVGRLIDHGINPEEIAWIDPAFAAGDLGGNWRAVSSNTNVSLFLDYLNSSPSFRYADAPHFAINDLDPHETCLLGTIADPLLWISQHLSESVHTRRTIARELTLADGQWTMKTDDGQLTSQNVVLAVGSTPNALDYEGLTEIPVEVALDPEKLAKEDLDGATVAVFGSSHSTMIALPNLLDTPVGKVINFYRGPLRYAVQFPDWMLHDDIGLKGHAARWARKNIDGTYPPRLERCSIKSPEFESKLATCDRVVYTVGFERRHTVKTPQWGQLDYNASSGIIAPGLFGLGIAYPHYKLDPLGAGQYRVGLEKFMRDLNQLLPIWLRYSTECIS